MICNACHNTFVSGTCLTCGVHALMDAERESCREEGRREALWNVYAACMFARGEAREFYVNRDGDRGIKGLMIGNDSALAGIALDVLDELARLGDTRAQEILRGER